MKVRHPAFNCLGCGYLMNNFSSETNVGDSIEDYSEYEVESYVLCEKCGAAYLVARSRQLQTAEALAQLHPKWAWTFVPDAFLPAEVRAIQSDIRSLPAFMTKGGKA